ncbi:MAG: hypothetical protein IT222_00690 [Crocinitomix sp.]|nr:hypothetical protein [Crocinitomix sp.]
MKQLKNNTEIHHIRFENKEMEAFVELQNTAGITLGIEMGKDQAVQHYPPLTEHNGALYYNKLKYHFQQIISYIKSSLQINLMDTERFDLNLYSQKEERITSEIKKADHDLLLASRELMKSEDRNDNKALPKKKRFKWVRIICILFVTADFFFSASSLQKIGFAFWAAHIVALAIGIGIYISAEMTPILISKINNKKGRVLVFIGILLFFIAIFYGLAYLRTSGKVSNDGDTMRRISFVFLNLFLLLISIVFIWFSRVTQAEQEQLDRYLLCVTKKEMARVAKANLEDKREQLHKEKQDALTAYNALVTYGSDMERRVIDAYHSAFAEYCSANVYHRYLSLEKGTPPFFNNPPELLMVHFTNQKK